MVNGSRLWQRVIQLSHAIRNKHFLLCILSYLWRKNGSSWAYILNEIKFLWQFVMFTNRLRNRSLFQMMAGTVYGLPNCAVREYSYKTKKIHLEKSKSDNFYWVWTPLSQVDEATILVAPEKAGRRSGSLACSPPSSCPLSSSSILSTPPMVRFVYLSDASHYNYFLIT